MILPDLEHSASQMRWWFLTLIFSDWQWPTENVSDVVTLHDRKEHSENVIESFKKEDFGQQAYGLQWSQLGVLVEAGQQGRSLIMH